ncbi:MAG: hypothetical protein ACTTHG_07075 [Treponemataceae bacterium]
MKKNVLTEFIFTIFFLIFLSACGIDTYYILHAPIDAVRPYDNSANRVFSFKTNDTQNISMSIFLGTNVFYKIYDNKSTCESEALSISNANKQYSDAGYKKIESLGYKQLKISTNKDPLIEKDGTNRSVLIRLYTEGVNSPRPEHWYHWEVSVAGMKLLDGSQPAIPLRSNGSTFDFFNNINKRDSGKKNVIINGKKYFNNIPVNTDDDVKLTATGAVTSYYVNAYAVSSGRDPSLTPKYGELLSLGYITINESDH